MSLNTESNLSINTAFQVEGSSETTEKVKKSLSSFLGVISDTLAPPPDKTIDCDVITLVATPAGTTEVYDSSKVGCSSSCTLKWTFESPVNTTG